MEDYLLVGFDLSSTDYVPVLTIGKAIATNGNKSQLLIMNQFFGDEAVEMYNKLIGVAIN